MDLSMKWINDYVDLKNIDIKQFCHEMTMSGSKVEGYETEGSEISNCSNRKGFFRCSS